MRLFFKGLLCSHPVPLPIPWGALCPPPSTNRPNDRASYRSPRPKLVCAYGEMERLASLQARGCLTTGDQGASWDLYITGRRHHQASPTKPTGKPGKLCATSCREIDVAFNLRSGFPVYPPVACRPAGNMELAAQNPSPPRLSTGLCFFQQFSGGG